MKLIRIFVVAIAMLISSFSSAANAENFTFNVQSNHPNIVSMEFYSQARNAAWPGDGQVYVLDDYATHAFTLSCNRGEQICYGAWVRSQSNTYWGVGLNDTQGCRNCCYTCNGSQTDVISLDP